MKLSFKNFHQITNKLSKIRIQESFDFSTIKKKAKNSHWTVGKFPPFHHKSSVTLTTNNGTVVTVSSLRRRQCTAVNISSNNKVVTSNARVEYYNGFFQMRPVTRRHFVRWNGPFPIRGYLDVFYFNQTKQC